MPPRIVRPAPSAKKIASTRPEASGEFHRNSLVGNLFQAASLHRLETYCHRLGLGLRSGVDILKVLETETRGGTANHRRVVESIKVAIRGGESLVSAMKLQSNYFPPLLLQMVSAGELSGGLDRIFEYMAVYYRNMRQSRAEFLRQLIKPGFQLLAAIAVISGIILLQGFIGGANTRPEEQFDALGFGLRGMTGLIKFWIFLAMLLSFIIVLAIGIWKNALDCHRWLIPLALRIPVIGGVLVNTSMARMSMTLSMMLNAGADAVRCLKQSFLATGNEYYIAGSDKALAAVERGESLADCFAAAEVIPNEFIEGVSIGEMSGNETESLDRLADEYERRAKVAMGRLCVTASTTIAVGTSLLVIFLILRLAMQYVAMLQSFMPK